MIYKSMRVKKQKGNNLIFLVNKQKHVKETVKNIFNFSQTAKYILLNYRFLIQYLTSIFQSKPPDFLGKRMMNFNFIEY